MFDLRQLSYNSAASLIAAKALVVLELQHETQVHRQVTYRRETRLLSGCADYTVWYEPQKRFNLATNLIIIEAKKSNSTDTCLGQLTAYMGVGHAYRKDEQTQNSVIYGAASDGLSFRSCRIDNEGNWSQSHSLEMEDGRQGQDMLVVQQREKVLVSVGSPERTRKFNDTLSVLELLEEDDDTDHKFVGI